eukprot:scaffold13609_cov151-Amphora_coffeaeformis.AAC.4
MAKKSDKSKKNAPKGKRARAKAKLERQWGEEAVEDTEAARHLRGKRTKEPKQQQHEETEEFENYDKHVEIYENGEDSDEEDDQGNNAKAVLSFVEQLRQKHRKEKMHNHQSTFESVEKEMKEDDDDDDNNDDESDNDDENAMEMEHLDPFTARFATVEELTLQPTKEKKVTTKITDKPRKVPLPFVKEGTMLQLSAWPPLDSLPAALPVERKEWRRLARRLWQTQKPLLKQHAPPSTSLSQVVYPLLSTYMDICQTVAQKNNDQQLYATHILNHIWTSRQRIYHHSKEWKQLEFEDGDDLEAKQDPKFRDQGFTRPAVLVLMPTRGICYQFVQTLLQILYGDDENARAAALGDRFETEYGPPEEVDTDPRRQEVLEQKGKEWNSLFGDHVNNDDDFKLGIALHLNEKQKRPTIKLYTDFSKSDLIVASPLGLKMLATKQQSSGDDGEADDEVEVTAPDYLSSIEICWVSHAHVLMMQNWDHLTDVLSWLNQRPNDTADTDFARVRPYFLEDDLSSASWRQLILTASYLDPSMKATFGRYATSRSGAARLTRKTSWPQAALTQIMVPTRQVFQRIPVSSVKEQTDARLEYFAKYVLPKIEKDKQPFTLIFVPSYLEFVSLRNFLLKREADYFVSVTEYARHTEVSRGRARFGQGRKSIMLYTGRAHFFHRHIVRGVRHVIWYGLPADPTVYTQVVDWCQDETTQTQHSRAVPESSVLALYTAYEAHALERIVGHAHCSRMTKEGKTTFLFAA